MYRLQKHLDKMSDEVVEIVGGVNDLEDGQYVQSLLLSFLHTSITDYRV